MWKSGIFYSIMRSVFMHLNKVPILKSLNLNISPTKRFPCLQIEKENNRNIKFALLLMGN